MMFKKALTKSGRRILRAIKNISSSARLAKKQQQMQQQQQQQHQQQAQPQQVPASWTQHTRLYDLDLDRLSVVSCSLPSLDTKSIDTFVTYVAPEGYYQYEQEYCCCCHCDERDENQRNENLENEMMR